MPFSRTLYYHKLILRKVSFEPYLFFKELKKDYQDLSYEDSLSLNRWLIGFYKNNPQLQLTPPIR